MNKEKNIGDTKLAALLATFSQWEWYRFESFCQSPYHNTQEELVQLVRWLSEQRHDLAQQTKQNVHKAILGNTKYEERQVNYWLSDLNKLAEQFLGLEKYLNQSHAAELHSMEALSERRLEKHVSFLKKKKTRQLDEQKQQDTESYLYPAYQFHNLLSENTYRKGERKANEYVQKAVDALDVFYFSEKLRMTCSMLNHQRVLASNYTFSFIDEIKTHLTQQTELLEKPVISLYFAIFQLLTKENADAEYQSYLHLLQTHQAAFSKKELTELHEYGLNFCAREIRKQRQEYVIEDFRLYKSGLELGLFMTEGVLSPWHFKNIVRLGLRTNEVAWTEQFIKEKAGLLEASFQQDALHYNLAELYFHTSQYDDALTHLNKVEFSDIHYNLGAKVMLAKIYKERRADDALESLLHAFKAFLRRNKALPPDTLKAYMNFVKLLDKINRISTKPPKALETVIENTELLVFKDWLLREVRG